MPIPGPDQNKSRNDMRWDALKDLVHALEELGPAWVQTDLMLRLRHFGPGYGYSLKHLEGEFAHTDNAGPWRGPGTCPTDFDPDPLDRIVDSRRNEKWHGERDAGVRGAWGQALETLVHELMHDVDAPQMPWPWPEHPGIPPLGVPPPSDRDQYDGENYDRVANPIAADVLRRHEAAHGAPR